MQNALEIQSPSTVLMIVPHHFRVNPETTLDNHFQDHSSMKESREQLSAMARAEVEAVITQLRNEGVRVLQFEDTATQTPDSVFPNNWFSTHADGKLIIYPMHCVNRRREVRTDIIEALQNQFYVSELIDLRTVASKHQALEGTGSMVFDHLHRRIYACRSARTCEVLLQRVASLLDYQTTLFDAFDERRHPIYHTNVMMSIGTGMAMIGSLCVNDQDRRHDILKALGSDRDVLELSHSQLGRFAGNTFELRSGERSLLAISSTAWSCLTNVQRQLIGHRYTPIICAIQSIERAGGSIRCMLAGIYLKARQN